MANDVIPVLESLRQGQYESEASLGYINSKPTWITQPETVTKKQTNKQTREGWRYSSIDRVSHIHKALGSLFSTP